MEEILKLYQEKYQYRSFYNLFATKIKSNNLVSSYYHHYFETTSANLLPYSCKPGDIRIDLPVWFGDFKKARIRLMIFGLEPRNSSDKFNIEINSQNQFVFGSPFGVEHWTDKNKYFQSFKNIISNQDIITYFTDVVKSYHVRESKFKSDVYARKNFWKFAGNDQDNIQFLIREVGLFKPDLIISLGNDSFRFLDNIFGEIFLVKKVIHPNARQNKKTGKNAWEVASESISEIVGQLY